MVKPESSDVGKQPTRGPADRFHLGYLLRQAAAAHRLRMERALADIDVTSAQFLIMTMLAVHADQSSADIARRASLTPPTISVIIANLERRGALARSPHPVHGRVQHLALTDEGRVLLVACRERAAEVERELTAGLPNSSAEIVLAWLTYVAAQAA